MKYRASILWTIGEFGVARKCSGFVGFSGGSGIAINIRLNAYNVASLNSDLIYEYAKWSQWLK
jgi:hypothetical protein